jgi:hypothetical protein
MNLKTTLIGSVGAVLALGVAGGAEAKTSKHHHRAGPSASESALRSEVNELQSEVKALEGRLDAQQQAQGEAAAQQQSQIAAAQAQAQTAQSTAQAAQTQVAAQQAQIETIPTDVDTGIKKFLPKPGWWNDTKVGGTMFADASYIQNKNDGVKNAQSGVDYDIKRMYLTVDHRFSDMFSANMTTDFTYDSTTKATQLYIKKAYLQTNLLGDAFIVRAGAADLPWVPFVEALYGYRYVDHVLIDNYSFGTSTDWGVHVLGSLMDHHIGYAFSVVNGEGYKIASTGTANRTNAVDVEGRVNVNISHFTVAVGGYDGKLGHDVVGTPTFNTAERFDAIGAYTDSRIRVGVEYMWAKFWNDVTQSNPAKTNTSEAVSAFGSFNFTKQFAVFGRWDWIKPQEDTAPNFHSDFYNVGISYKPIGPLDFALVYKHDSVLDGLLSTQNGAIGTLNKSGVGKGVYDEVGIFTQMKF